MSYWLKFYLLDCLIQETLISLVQAMCGDLLSYWLSLCKDILASSIGVDRSTIQIEEKTSDLSLEEEEEKEVRFSLFATISNLFRKDELSFDSSLKVMI